MAESTVRIGIYANDKASGSIKSVQGLLQGIAKDAKTSILTGIGLGAGVTAFNVMAKAVGAVTDALGGMVRNAIADEESVNRLRASLESNISAFDGNTDAIERNIKASQRLGFDDETLRDSLTVLVGATHDVTRAQEYMATAMDLARFKGIDLRTASEALIKVSGGHYRALAQLGIKLREGATATEALAAVQAVAAGQAEAYADTTAGAMAGAEIAMAEAGEELGRVLMPAITDLAEFVRDDLAPALEDLGHLFAEQPGEINRITEAIYHLTGGFSGMSAQMQIDEQQSNQFLDALRDAPPVLDEATGAVERHGFSYEEMAERLKDGMGEAQEGLRLGLDALVGELAAAETEWEKGWQDYLDILNNDMDKAQETAYLMGILTGDSLEMGLNSTNETTRLAAEQMKATVEERLFALEHGVDELAARTGMSYADALALTKTQVFNAAHVLRENAAAPLVNLPNHAWNWGKATGVNFANGMLAANAYVKYAGETLASQAAGSLAPWHSPPRFGPLKDLDTDAQELGQLWAQNLGKGIGQSWMPNVDLGANLGGSGMVAAGMTGAVGGSLPDIRIYLDGRELQASNARWERLSAPGGPSVIPR